MTPAEARVLYETGREHDEKMTQGEWDARHAEVWSVDECHPDYDMRLVVAGRTTHDPGSIAINARDAVANAAGIAWMRTNFRGLLDGFADALVENERLRAELAKCPIPSASIDPGPAPVDCGDDLNKDPVRCPHCLAGEPSVWDDVLFHYAHPAGDKLKMCHNPWREPPVR